MKTKITVNMLDYIGDIIEKILEEKFRIIENCEDFEEQVDMMNNTLYYVKKLGWDYGTIIRENMVLKGLDFYLNPYLYEDEIEEGMNIQIVGSKHWFTDETGQGCFLEAEL